MRLDDVEIKFSTPSSEEVKSVDLHSTEKWILLGLMDGNLHVWNYENEELVMSFKVKLRVCHYVS